MKTLLTVGYAVVIACAATVAIKATQRDAKPTEKQDAPQGLSVPEVQALPESDPPITLPQDGPLWWPAPNIPNDQRHVT